MRNLAEEIREIRAIKENNKIVKNRIAVAEKKGYRVETIDIKKDKEIGCVYEYFSCSTDWNKTATYIVLAAINEKAQKRKLKKIDFEEELDLEIEEYADAENMDSYSDVMFDFKSFFKDFLKLKIEFTRNDNEEDIIEVLRDKMILSSYLEKRPFSKKEFGHLVSKCMTQFGKILQVKDVILNEGAIYNPRVNEDRGVSFFGKDAEQRTIDKMWRLAKKNGRFYFNGELYVL